MKHPSAKKVLFLATFSFLVVGCGQVSAHPFSYIPGTLLSIKNYSALTYHDFFFQSVCSSAGPSYDSLLSKGDEKALVIPIDFQDYRFTTERLKDLNVAFNGEGSKDTKYWESIKSFYDKSSFGQLSLSFTIASPYQVDVTASSFLNKSDAIDDSVGTVTSLLKKAVADYKTKTATTCSEFDVDKNGYIDAVYLIYACPNYDSASLSDSAIKERRGYWAYSARDSSRGADVASPIAKSFTWASYDFMYRGVAEGDGVDAHTYIHETGHLLGLDDYYSYSPNNTSYTKEDYKYYTPTGGLDMMDLNVLDHDAWSKFALGWTKPYVITKDLSFPLTVSLNESQLSGDFLLIPDASSEYNGTAFGEYMVVELYTPDGLNALDAQTKYASPYEYPRGFFIPGVKISHVDARIANCTNLAATSYEFVADPASLTQKALQLSTSSSYYKVAQSNTPNQSSQDGYRLIHLMEASGVNTFQNKNYLANDKKYFYANNGSLFQPEDQRYLFDMTRFSTFFQNTTKIMKEASSSSASEISKGLFNNGHEFGYNIQVNGYQKTTVGSTSTYKVSLTIDKA